MCRLFTVLLVYVLFNSLFAEPKEKMIVLGFDGLDYGLAKQWIDQGHLPNMAELEKQGTFLRLETTNPAQSPVAWATFATGTNPGKHRIFGFLKRKQDEYRPVLGLASVEMRTPLGTKITRSLAVAVITSVILGILLIVLRRYQARIKLIISLGVAMILGGALWYIAVAHIPYHFPYPVAMRSGESFWNIIARSGIKTHVMLAPVSFPAHNEPGAHMLCGFGVPDIAATNGTWYRYSTRYQSATSTETGGWLLPLKKDLKNFRGTLWGPKNLLLMEEQQQLQQQLQNADFEENKAILNRLGEIKKHQKMSCDFSIQQNNDKSISLVVNEQRQTISQGAWSDWFMVSFQMSPVLKIYGMCRFKVIQAEQEVELYCTPIQFHPQHLPSNVSLSYPPSYAGEIAKEVGIYPTLGWAAATNPLKDEMIDDETFLEDLQSNIKMRRKIFDNALQKSDWDLLIQMFYFPDRASHMFWRFLDKSHPRYSKDIADYPDGAKVILDVYKQVDEIIGQAHRHLGKEGALVVVSDHGFSSFRWEANLNTWLCNNGYLKLKNKSEKRMQVAQLFTEQDFLQEFDWKNTSAYAIGLGKIYLNVQGRDRDGYIPAEEYQKVRQEISEKLLNWEYKGLQVVEKVYLREEIFQGEYANEAADIEVGFNAGYRVSWQTCLGGVPADEIEPNNLKWSGDHCSVAPHLVPGVFFCNRKVESENLCLQDMAMLIMSFYGVEIPQNMDGNLTKIKK